jgi:hypothetical protein
LGNEDAVAFATNALIASHDWDDLEDEGRTAHNPLICWLAFGKEYDPYFRRHSDILRPIMLSAYLQWSVANAFEAKREYIERSYMLRVGLMGLFHMIAFIEGGHDWAEQIGPKIYKADAETLDDLRKEFECPVPQ